ncbi:MAG: ribonuclease Z [Ruminococcaceae bacterium]|nr:ribonuclease Z [Oscillospiraceae bacterium]
MTLIVCIDDKNGMMFGSKRQSRDGTLIQRILALTEGKRLVLSPYSAPLFSEKKELLIHDDPASVCEKDDFFFAENTPLPEKKPDGLLIYRWNRRYPATRFFNLSTEGFTLTKSSDFCGSSHERITEERWESK